MKVVVDSERMWVLVRAVGDELRHARRVHGWTRKDLILRLARAVSSQTLSAYEWGSRNCSLVRFVEICVVLDERPSELLARAEERVFTEEPVRGQALDLVAASRIELEELSPLRRWAQCRLQALPTGEPTVVHLDLPAVRALAAVCGISTVDLGRLLPTLLPSPAAGERRAG